jgi:hypothetical protein
VIDYESKLRSIEEDFMQVEVDEQQLSKLMDECGSFRIMHFMVTLGSIVILGALDYTRGYNPTGAVEAGFPLVMSSYLQRSGTNSTNYFNNLNPRVFDGRKRAWCPDTLYANEYI